MGYVTSYCNKPHSEQSGKPIEHECYVLPPEAIRLEKAGDTDAAVRLLQSSAPLRRHRGVMARPAWWPKRMSAADFRELDNENGGICIGCGELDVEQGCEPDARGYECGSCGEKRVYGAEEARMMGVIEVDE